ncbi:MAG: TraR/DksA C4-type zinc finger protein [Actinomycetota bacterium]
MAQKTSAKTKSKTTPSRAASSARKKAKSVTGSAKPTTPARAASRRGGASAGTAAKKVSAAKRAPAAKTAKAKRGAGPKGPAPKAAATRAKPSTAKAAAYRAKTAPPGKAATKPPSGARSVAKARPKAPPKATGKAKASKGAEKSAGPVKSAPRRRAPGHFDAQTLAGIERKLVEQRAELLDQLHDLEETSFNLSQSEMSGEVSYDEDYADAGSFTFEREKDLSIANNVQDLLDKINRAIGKIEDGTYGICESCGEPIDAARLRALPHVSLCIRCKKAEERR